MNYNSVISKSVIFALLQKSSQMLYGVISIPIILSALGKTEYGIWIIISQLIALSYFLDLGIGNSFSRFLTRLKKKNMNFAIDKLFSTAFIFIGIISTVILFFSFIFSHEFLSIYGLDSSQIDNYNNIFLLGLVFAMIVFPFRIFTGVYLSYHKLPILDIVISAVAFSKLIILYLLYKSSLLSITSLVYVVNGMELMSFLILYYFARNFLDFNILFEKFDLRLLKIIFSFSLYNIAFSFFMFVLLQYPVFFISKYVSVDEVILFSIPIMILVSIGAILGRVGTVFTPISIELNKNYNRKKLSEMLFKYNNLISFFALTFFIILNFIGEPLIAIWLTDLSSDDITNISKIFIMISFPYLTFVGFTGIKNTLFANGLHKSLVVSNISILLFILLLLLFSPTINHIVYSFITILGLLVLSYLLKIRVFFEISFFELMYKNFILFLCILIYFVSLGVFL
ncbi:hypothetical protein AF80_00065 [Aliarcobacter butzleri L355]|uniref:Polysaccharide biosynthesis protein n=1 Tax=Aliarcobacter butzleri L355 TaxID=1447263 RepID=A0A0G9KYV4_9BACT|nr:hypothetical protein [Aliarcobacter butzleri]KLE11777.1 hypothetical protein AF80_00065 [Aliarcobacter butzleri L355]